MLGKVVSAWSLKDNLRLLLRPPEARRFQVVDGLRALSILWVVVFHLVWYLQFFLPAASFRRIVDSPLTSVILNGHFSVDVFFVISGFLIAGMLTRELEARDRIDFGRFYARRALRLLPAYYFALLLNCALSISPCDRLWANLLYVNNYIPLTQQCVPWAWSLAIEEQFYFLFPLVLWGAWHLGSTGRRLAMLVAILACALTVSLWMVLTHGWRLPGPLYPTITPERFTRYFDAYYGQTHARFGALVVGVLAWFLYRYTSVVRRLSGGGLATGMILMSGGTVAGLAWYDACNPDLRAGDLAGVLYMSWVRPLFSTATAALLLAGLGDHPWGRALRRWLSAPVFYPVGQLAYSAYLLHPMCIILVYSLGAHWAALQPQFWMVLMAIAGAVSFLSAAVVYTLLERPFMNIRIPEASGQQAGTLGTLRSAAPVAGGE